MLAANVLQDADLHTRLAATLVIAEMPEAADISQALYRESQKTDNYTDKWLSRAFYIAALRHKTAFTTAYKADKAALPFDSLPVALRLGALKPDWRLPQRQGHRGGLEGHAGARQLGVARPAGLRRRRLVHAHDRRAGGGRDWHADALVRARCATPARSG